ncbi:sigma-70 family RNA polymerase sigma factor [Hoyosella subflava]|uniref:RNA polymerase sigma-70 factor, ECF subfamily n=1 Tax=Hoyosella subflava (strain DSM 45089 / JCM 17490 / NBRC 109087 / DQS3-9A1) TaxID=443218 RepID=F6EQ79_HOYSD|nr:sigma-70 family RNA polymerase sigma factor [Hoyosella subflava]AEF39502.1 RNA polymerase sigma-70 factor, ECF subfamily [Hoyosella subflava DQS3-9A1]
MPEHERVRAVVPAGDDGAPEPPEVLLSRASLGDEEAFAQFYDHVTPSVFGLVRRIVRDHAQSEEVTQDVLVELWRTAPRFDPERGSAMTWAMTLAHRRAVDRVRSAQASTDRERKAAYTSEQRSFDEVSEKVDAKMERRQVQRCLGSLTELQRESVMLAFYQGYTYPEVATLLKVPLGTIKTRMRDGLIRLRDCMGVSR